MKLIMGLGNLNQPDDGDRGNTDMKLIVGLGNPELKYMTTRHNAGYWIVDKLATTYGAHYARSRDMFADVAKTNINGEAVLLAKPTTYMNLSGQAFQAITHWYKLELDQCIVVHDDVALPLGRLRYQKGGGAGGQHGIESIIRMMGGNKGFDRLKFGVGPDPGGDRRADYVLSSVPEADRELKDKMIALATESLHLWLREGATVASNKFNATDLRPAPPPPPPTTPTETPPETPPPAAGVDARRCPTPTSTRP
jgi:PTH1 family peptidyl-tRNA hydrolase